MLHKYITPHEYEGYLQDFVGRKIVEFYYITDCMIVFTSGRKYLDHESTVKGETFQIYEYEYELWIWGFWKYIVNGKVVESTNVKPGEDGPAFRGRIDAFSDTIHPKQVTDIKVSREGRVVQIYLDNGGKFVVRKYEDCLVSYVHHILNDKEERVKVRHARPEEYTGKFEYVEAP